jgi:hypothetical protein
MKRLKLLALLICAIAISSGIGYYVLTPREVKPPTQSPTEPSPPEKKPGLYVSLLLNATSLMFLDALNVTSLIENTNGRGIDSLEILQTYST